MRTATWAVPVALLAAQPAVATAADLHVAPTGDDNGPGTAADPLREVRECIARVSPGDRCVIAPGDYDADLAIDRSGEASGLTGVVACERGRTTVSGEGTRFESEVRPGDFIRCGAEPDVDMIDHRVHAYFPWTEVAAVESDTELTLVEGYRGVSDRAGQNDDAVGRFVVLQGTGDSPLDVRLTHWVALDELGITPVPAPGQAGVFYFDLPHETELDRYFPDRSAGRYAGIMQADWDSPQIPPASQLIGQTEGPEHFINWPRVRGIRGTSCATEANYAAFTEQWPGTYWVATGDGTDRWYFKPRNEDGDRIFVGRSRHTLVAASYVVVRNLATFAAQAGVVDTRTNDGGVQLTDGITNVQFRDYWHFGNKWGGVGRHENTERIVLEHAKLNYGFGGYLGARSGMYAVEVARSAKSFNGAAGSWDEDTATVFDRVWHHNSMTYLYDTACDAPGLPADYHWATGTHDGDSHGATHGWYTNQGTDEANYAYALVLNSVVEMTTEGLLFASSGGRVRYYNNTLGQAPRGHGNAMRLSPAKSTPLDDPSIAEIANTVFVDAKGEFNFWYRNLGLGRFDEIHRSDYNAFLKGDTSRVVLSEDGTHYEFDDLVELGYEQHGLIETEVDVAALFVDPQTVGGSDYTPVAGNPVIDAGDAERCPSYDFYGNLRDAACDMGAVELDGVAGGDAPLPDDDDDGGDDDGGTDGLDSADTGDTGAVESGGSEEATGSTGGDDGGVDDPLPSRGGCTCRSAGRPGMWLAVLLCLVRTRRLQRLLQ